MTKKKRDKELAIVIKDLMKGNNEKGLSIYEYYDHSISFEHTNHKDLIKQIKEIWGNEHE